MSRVPIVTPMSWKKVDSETVELIRTFYPELLNNAKSFPVNDFMEFKLSKLGWDWEIAELSPKSEAEVNFDEKVLRVSEETYNGLYEQPEKGNRHRFTIMHEIGHICLHSRCFSRLQHKKRSDVVMHRRSEIKPYEDPECQANVFASCILMPTSHIINMLNDGKDFMDFSKIFKVSLEAAKYRQDGIYKFI